MRLDVKDLLHCKSCVQGFTGETSPIERIKLHVLLEDRFRQAVRVENFFVVEGYFA